MSAAMRVLSTHERSEREPGTAVTIGNFDGVHLGHRALIDAATAFARSTDSLSCVLTFEPHPVRVLAPRLAPPLICNRADKAHLLERAGVELLVEQPFDRDFAGISPETFARQVLWKGLAARHVVVGYDFTFGRKRAGTTSTLKTLGAELGFSVEVVEARVVAGGLVASSTKVREFVLGGRMRGAALVLGRPYHLFGRVVRGDQRGRGLGFPTANLAVDTELLPKVGVYAGWLDWGEGARAAVVNLGLRPTFTGGDAQPRVEAHVIDAELDLYGRDCRLFFAERLRDERRFDGIEALSAQIAADRDAARAVLAVAEAPLW